MRLIVLIIKGSNVEAATLAANQRGVVLASCERRLGTNECLAKTTCTYLTQIVRWFTEREQMVNGYGYPDGSLLFYNELPENKPGQIMNGADHG